MEECGFCKDRDSKMRNYLEEIDKEKVRECQRALEREKIAKGMQCTKEDELRLREMQRLQMMEKKYMEQQTQDVDRMWHQVLVDDVRKKEQKERLDYARRQQEMAERRRAYDEQIASAARKRQEALRVEREKENRRLDKMREKMELDHYEAIRRKKEQQMTNRVNLVEGHEMKLLRLWGEKKRDREIDDGTIRVALEELRREQQRKMDEIHRLQIEKEVFVQNFTRERRIATALEEDGDRITREWKRQEETQADEYLRAVEAEKIIIKEKAAEEYRRYLNERKEILEKERQERSERMVRVKRTAVNELMKKMDNANEELRRQNEYRRQLKEQIWENQIYMETELNDIECKQKPFTRKPEMFKDAMEHKVAHSPGRTSTNPVHPFRRIMEKREAGTTAIQLPLIGKRVI